MKHLKAPYFIALLLALFALVPGSSAHDDLFITEFMAENDNTVADEDNDFPDWIEIYNAGTNNVNLAGWYLTDNPGNLTQWRFPATNLAVNSYLIVFASNKDRRTPGRPLHSNFQIDNAGEYLALVRPDGATISSAYTPVPPIQVSDTSYGFPVVLNTITLVTTGAAARLTVPVSDALGLTWTQPAFGDGSWASVNNGVGFEADAASTGSPVLIADSVTDFSGTQGQSGWFYGYWSKKTDPNGTYEPGDFTPFPRDTGNVLSSVNAWDGTKWDWFNGNPPWTEITSTGGHPSGDNGNAALPIHWTIRRYVSETNGSLRITGTLACQSANGTCGDGVVGHILVDGVEVYQRTVSYSSVGYSIVVSASLGSQIDFVIDPGAAGNDSCDTTTFTASIRSAAGASAVADSIADWSDTGGQGVNNWSYGYFNRTTGATYTASKFIPFPSGTGPQSSANYWNGQAWQWFNGEPPFDTIGEVETLPSIFATGGANGNEHWVIRRWVSEVAGTVQVDWHLAKKQLTGGGVMGTVYLNGTQRDTYSATAADFTGSTRTLSISGVQVGDFIDFAVAPGVDIFGDLSFLNATIHGTGTLSNQFASDVGALMTNINATAYLRIPFTVTDVSAINGLNLRMKHDDGFVAWLNGVQVASAHAPETPAWNSTATGPRPDTDAAQFTEFNLDGVKDLLLNGSNLLAIQGLNASAADSDFLISAELRATTATLNTAARRYFSGPTPGSLNGVGTTNLGPLITKVKHTPAEPADTEDLQVTARIAPSLNPVTSVSLYYRVMYGAEASTPMLDDGLHADGAAGDGVFGALIPNTLYTNGQMIRYYFIASDSAGNLTRLPPLGDTNNSSLYFGTVVQDPSVATALPVLQWFIPAASGSALDAGSTAARCSLYWKGEFYDNVRFTRHGQSSSGFRKKSYNVDFNPDHHFKVADGQKRVDDINWLNTYPDKSHLRNMLSYGIHADAGPRSPSHYVVPVRVQSNAVFYGTMHIVENGDDNYVDRIGRDKNGALYKMYDTMSSASTAEKKTRRFEDRADLTELISRSSTGNATNRNWIYDNVDVSQTINFLAAMVVTANIDCCHKNYYVYRDTEGDREWEMLPWDVDLSFGRNWQSGETYWDDRVYPNNNLLVGGNATLPAALFAGGTTTRAMYMRRVRSIQDQLLQTNGTPAAQLNFEKQIDSWAALLTPDALKDIQKWGTWGGGQQNIFDTNSPYWRPLPQSVLELKTNYLVNRRKWVFDQKMGNTTEFPDAQPTNATVLLGALDYNPSSGNQAQEYLQIINTNAYAVDISGWKLSGAVEHTFQGGVVIPRAGSSNILYVVGDKKAFRNRTVAPKGGGGVYVEGPYSGQLSARGETIVISDTTGRIVTTNLYLGNPSGPQQWLRITEIMYHPPGVPAGSPFEAEDFEYIELRNTGPTNLPLAGVHFTNGIEFSFTGSAITTLAPGEYALVVRNISAFTNRYGPNSRIAGQYVGILDNGGEQLRLDDAVGEKILDFDYDNAWYPFTDGPGGALVIVNQNALWNTWGLKASWRPSAFDYGSPASSDPATNTYAAVVINEVLTHTDLPQRDYIEILNATEADANIGGYFITDDFATPKKFRVPNGTVIARGGYAVFDETQFNAAPGSPTSFALSSKGDEVYIFSADGTNLTGYFQGYTLGAAQNGVSFGRYTNSLTNVHFVAQSALTPNSANAAPKVGPAVLSEIQYHPVPLGGVDNSIDEYIEVANTSGAPLPLYDTNHPANTWRLRSAVDYNFPTNLTLPSGGFVVVTAFDPSDAPAQAAFRQRYSISPATPVVGPFSGKLGNTNETIRLYKPDAPETNDVPYILVDQIDYENKLPWPSAADGTGLSLQRANTAAYGNDPANWLAKGPSPGSPYVPGGTPPSITAQPVSTSGVRGQSAMFSVTASGTAPLIYQWRQNGVSLPGANSSVLQLNNLDYPNAGAYSVFVINTAGGIESASATLSVLTPASITQQPTNFSIKVPTDPGANPTNRVATFTVAATTSNPPLRYQWRFNGTNLDSALNPTVTNASLTITNLMVENGGDYSCLVSDGVGTVPSGSATLFALVTPVIVLSPIAQTVPAGSLVNLSVAITGNPAPFGYLWRIGSVVQPLIISSERTNFVTLTTSTNAVSVIYRVVVTNAAAAGLGVFAQFNIVTVADTDRDGIADSLETSLGLDPNSPADAAGDLDGDGMKNLAEILAGTEANNPNSYLRVDLTSTNSIASVQLAAVSNRTYTVQFTDALRDAGSTWSKLADVLARTNNRVETFPDPTWTTNRFYRVVLPARP